MRNILSALAIVLISSSLFSQENENYNKLRSDIDILVSKMTLEEKASLCSGRDDWSTKPIERLDVPWIWMSDGPHGLRRAPATNKAGYGDQLEATCFPTASAMAATWDVDLLEKIGIALAHEAQSMNVNILLGPGVNIKRSVLGGRNFEFFSEDPILSGELGAAYIKGAQGEGVGTSLKHYVANNVETMRMYMNSNLDERTLNEIYLTPFEIAVKKAQPWTVMACYNRVQGEYGTQSPKLLSETLYKEWGYEGIVISDWIAVVDRVEAIKAGMHIEMPGSSRVNDEKIVEAVKGGNLDEAQLDKLVKEILFVVFKAKSLEKENVKLDIEGHHNFAREIVTESITLLKNNEDILPITKKKYKKIAIIGEFATNPRYQGNGSSEVKPTKLDKALDIIKKEYSNDFKITYAQGYSLKNDDDTSLIEEAKKIAKKADIVLVFAGLPLHYESEGIDRKHIFMPKAQNILIDELSKVNKKIVAVLTNGSAIAMPWEKDVDAILETWLGGQAGAAGTSDVLFGKVNPSGKLAETFPVKLEDTPSFFNFPGEQGDVLYGERIFVGYRYYDIKKIEPLFPFGHGLSYTNFKYSDLEVKSNNFTDEEGLELSIKIKNTGKVDGKEIVQLYVGDNESSLMRPTKELKKFAKVELKAGEEKTVNFKLNSRDFSYYDARRKMWIAESGKFKILLASSSRDIRQSVEVEMQSTQKVHLCFDEYTFVTEYWNNKETRELIKQVMPKWISAWVPEGKTMDDAVFHGFFVDQPLIKLPFITNGEVSDADVKMIVEKSKNITYTP